MVPSVRISLFFCLFVSLWPLHGAEKYSPSIAEKSAEAELALHRFKTAGGLRGQVFAAEPMLANPVAFCIDEKGRVFVAETFRQSKGVEDNRGHMNWLLDDLAAMTVADRVKFFEKHQKEEIQEYSREHDRIRRLVDRDGDGVADEETVFADGFSSVEEGTGAGLLALNGSVYYTCIPRLWRLNDTDDDGVADERTAMFDGFGVRVAFRGHDLHGLTLGPDGRIYFSIGDRGYNIELKDGTRLVQPDQGAVFRCYPDGSNFEVFCTGLRNPQELAFDAFGNLFTGDNNSDGGDRARWMYLTEGSDTGWRMYYQYLSDRGPWSREKLWHTPHTGQAAYIVPPIAHFADGPSGLAYYPGTGLDERYQGHFFLADFRGQAGNSGIRNFTLIPKGASFELVNAEQFIWSILATDIDFGFDGGVYVSDWVDGWEGLGKGRIYRFIDNDHGESEVVKQVSTLMREGFDSRSPEELVQLLSHPDYRIRQRAQFALAERNAAPELAAVATSGNNLFARIHAIWGLGQIGRQHPEVLEPILPLMTDKEPEVRVQVARVCGDARYASAAEGLTSLVKDLDSRVRCLAAIAVGKLKYAPAYVPLLEALAENGDSDPTLRHGLIMGLVGVAQPEQLMATSHIKIPAVRLGAVVALRRMAHPGLAAFLNDPDPLVVVEAARAIHDLPVSEAMPALARMINLPGLSEPVLRRAISANYRIGLPENAEAVAAYAANPLGDEAMRVEALAELDEWNSPGPLDRVTNEYRPLPARETDIAAIVTPWLGSYFAGSTKLRETAAKLGTHNKVNDVQPYLVEALKDAENTSASLRVASLAGLRTLSSPDLGSCVAIGLKDSDASVRSEARRILAEIEPARAVKLMTEALSSSSVDEQQQAISSLASVKHDDAETVLLSWMDQLIAGKVADSIQLDLLNAAETRGTKKLQAKVAAFDKTRRVDDHLANYRESLAGGNVERGKEVFFGRAAASCRRCHKVEGSGSDVGPDLSGVGREKNREYLLESIVDPNKQIAKGFETAVLALASGKVYAGIVKSEDEEKIRLQLPDGQIIPIEKSEIEDRATGKSGMPEDIVKKLSKSDIRDLVEYLASLKSAKKSDAHGEKQ